MIALDVNVDCPHHNDHANLLCQVDRTNYEVLENFVHFQYQYITMISTTVYIVEITHHVPHSFPKFKNKMDKKDRWI